ncbi:MAG: NAD(P)/FAD-dependent oxidoreductase [Oscillospiraceae bacterium]|nr:NAD(P)/FAD-dependent oxidoreductase [Oscillospiraceae bacterium]
MKEYVIIGGGAAGVSCVEGIRSRDPEGKITLVSAEPVSNYGRPLISYYLEGKTGLDRMSWRGADFYERMRVDALHGVRAERLDPEARRVTLSGGAELPYDALCVCAGSDPFSPRFEGIETVEKRFSFTTLADALALEQAVDGDTRVLIVGAGFIGLKCAEGLRDRAKSVTVCDLAPRAMSASLDGDSSPILERHLEKCGIRLMLGNTVTRFDGGTALMQSGDTVGFDVLVIAIGVRPNTSLVSDAGGAVGRGITVNEKMETSLPRVWAAGDCTESRELTTGETGVLAILPNASMQGRCAGTNMAGGDAVFDKGIRMNSIGFFGLHIMSAGSCTDPVFTQVTETGCKKLFARDGVLTGFILMGDVSRAGIYTSLIRERTPLDTIDFDAVCREPSLLPFGRAYRAKKLGGAV